MAKRGADLIEKPGREEDEFLGREFPANVRAAGKTRAWPGGIRRALADMRRATGSGTSHSSGFSDLRFDALVLQCCIIRRRHGMIMSVRLDPATRGRLARLASESGKTLSALIREAIDLLAHADPAAKRRPRPYDDWAPVIGCARGLPRDLSTNRRKYFREHLVKMRARNAAR